MQPPREPRIIHRDSGRLRAAPLCPLVNLRLLIIKRRQPAQVQKGHSTIPEATSALVVARCQRRNFIHRVQVPTMFLYFHDPVYNSRRRSRPLQAYMLHNNPLPQSCNFHQSCQPLQGHTRTQPWHNNSKGRLSSSKNVEVELPNALATMVLPGSQTPSGQG